MYSSETDYDSIKSLIPLYIKGILSDSQRLEVERALLDSPELRKEFDEWTQIHHAYDLIAKELPVPSNDSYSTIRKRSRKSECGRFFERLMHHKKVASAVIAAQLLIMIAMGFYIAHLKGGYKTLSTTSITEGKSMRINVVFKKETSEAEIRDLLRRIYGRIIDGPYASGLYVIEIPHNKEAEHTLSMMKRNKIIEIAEKAY
jgi:hypothetical protein